jgi:SAM-dependent methyltransferase
LARLATLDRSILERLVLPAFAARSNVSSLLFVGCADYTRSYQQLFERAQFWTLDVDPACSVHGSSQPGRHVVASLSDVGALFAPKSFDLVLVNGVFGYGLDDRVEAERALDGCFHILKPGGTLMIGWNDLPECTPFDILGLDALKHFRREAFAPLERHEDIERLADGNYLVLSDYRHVFSFFSKPA